MGKSLDSQSSILKSKKSKNWLKIEMEVLAMKGYYVGDGYMGYVEGEYLLFADETDYREYIED